MRSTRQNDRFGAEMESERQAARGKADPVSDSNSSRGDGHMRFITTFVFLMAVAGSASAQDASEAVGRGGQIYSMVCDNCHNTRLPAEYGDEEWTVIVMHMRTRADLSRSEAEAVAAFLRAANGEGDAASSDSTVDDSLDASRMNRSDATHETDRGSARSTGGH